MISVVICTHNGRHRLGSVFASLKAQLNPPEFELLLVDNASVDGTGEWAELELAALLPASPWRVMREASPGLLYARMAGLREASYPWVLFCDDDTVLFPDFLSQCGLILTRDQNLGVLGSLGIPEFLGPKPDWFDRYSSSFAVGPQGVSQTDARRLVHVYGACSVYRKEPLLRLFQSGFSPVLSGRKGKVLSAGDDVEWCWLMQLLGYRIAYAPELKFYHQLPASRLRWDYYLRLKQGISGSAGLLSSYTFFSTSKSRSLFAFWTHYLGKTASSVLRYVKYRLSWGSQPKQAERQLSLTILHAQMKSYLSQGRAAAGHFQTLVRFFGS